MKSKRWFFLRRPSIQEMVSSAFLVPFFILQCPGFEVGLIFIMALGIVSGSLSGAMGTIWILNRARVETP
jgi:hypothetical protein